MTAQRLCAMILVLGLCIAAAVVLAEPVFPLIVGLVGVWGTTRRWTWPLRRMHVLIIVLLLALASAVQFRMDLFARRFADLNAVALASWGTLIRLLLLTLLMTLYLGRSPYCPVALALFPPAIGICVGQIVLVYEYDVLHRIIELVSVTAAVIYAWTCRDATGQPGPPPARVSRPSGPAVWVGALVLAVALNFGWFLGSVLYDQQDWINILAAILGKVRSVELLGPAEASEQGFLATGRIHALRDMLLETSPEVLFRVESETPPRYLRTAVFERYTPWQWHPVARPRRFRPVDPGGSAPALSGPGAWFRLEPAATHRWRTFRVIPEPTAPDGLFTSLGTDWIRVPARRLWVTFSGVCRVEGPRRAPEPYSVAVAVDRPAQPLPDRYRQACLTVPETLDPRVIDFARQLFADAATTQQKVAAVRQHFLRNYTYSLSVEVSEDRDLPAQFLFETDRGFCEYFATVGALLLRLGGVPTRYVTGMLVTEREGTDGPWVARLMDAHAWVEAWDESGGRWEIVDPTVPLDSGGVIDDVLDPLGRGAALRWSRLRALVYRYGLAGPLLWLLEPLGLPWLAPAVVAAVAAAGALWLWRRRVRRVGADVPDPLLNQLETLRRQVDRALARRGFRRPACQTLHAFAERLECMDDPPWAPQAAAWYRRYACVRYAPRRLSELEPVLDSLRRMPFHPEPPTLEVNRKAHGT